MIVKTLTLRGFRSFRDEHALEFPEGPLFISGRNHDDPLWNSNGSGKTSLIAAVFWALWGALPTGAKKDQVIHEQAQEAFVEVDLGGLVVRRRKARNRSEVLSYFHEGAWKEPDLDIAQAGLEGILGIAPRLAENSVWVGPDSKTVQFLYARPADRLALIEGLTESVLLEQGRGRANKRATALREALRQHQLRISGLQDQKKQEESRLLQAQVEYQRVHDDNQNRVRRLENQAHTLKAELRRVESQISELEQVENTSALAAQLQALKLERQRQIRAVQGGATVVNRSQICPTCRRPL